MLMDWEASLHEQLTAEIAHPPQVVDPGDAFGIVVGNGFAVFGPCHSVDFREHKVVD